MKDKIKEIAVHDEYAVMGFFGKYRFLSNFHLSPVWFEGIEFPSSEHAYQAAKWPIELRDEKFRGISCKQSKIVGKEGKLYTSKEWDKVRFNIMFRIVTEKFMSNPELMEKLDKLHGLYLEETNWWNDTYWGVCEKKGENQLGKILMSICDSQHLDDEWAFNPLN